MTPSVRSDAVAAVRMRAVAARARALMARRLLETSLARAGGAWGRQTRGVRIAIAAAAIFALAGTLNLVSVTLVRTMAPRPQATAAATAATAPLLVSEAQPAEGGKVWTVVATYNGADSLETAPFTVAEHWRVDWLFSPSQPKGVLQVFVFAADGRKLLELVTNTTSAGGSSRFWAGPGTYFLRINATGGDWKVGVQDLR